VECVSESIAKVWNMGLLQQPGALRHHLERLSLGSRIKHRWDSSLASSEPFRSDTKAMARVTLSPHQSFEFNDDDIERHPAWQSAYFVVGKD